MKKFLFIISVIFVMVSCNPIPNKSITEPLTKKEFVKIQEKTDVETANMLSTLSVLPFTKKYQDVTYRDILKYREMSLDSSYWETYKVEWEKEYNETYKNSLHKFDSIITLCEYYYVNFDSLYFEKYNRKFNDYYSSKEDVYYYIIMPDSLRDEIFLVNEDVYDYVSSGEYPNYQKGLKIKIIQGQIDENYMNIYEFLNKKKREILSNKFPMVHQFAVEISEL